MTCLPTLLLMQFEKKHLWKNFFFPRFHFPTFFFANSKDKILKTRNLWILRGPRISLYSCAIWWMLSVVRCVLCDAFLASLVLVSMPFVRSPNALRNLIGPNRSFLQELHSVCRCINASEPPASQVNRALKAVLAGVKGVLSSRKFTTTPGAQIELIR